MYDYEMDSLQDMYDDCEDADEREELLDMMYQLEDAERDREYE